MSDSARSVHAPTDHRSRASVSVGCPRDASEHSKSNLIATAKTQAALAMWVVAGLRVSVVSKL